MKSYILDIIPKIQRFSKQLDDSTNLIGHHWVLFSDSLNELKTVYIFRSQNELLISRNGIVEKSKWEYIGNESIIIETDGKTYLLKHGFLDENILALRRDSFNDFSIFINESKANQEFNSIDDVVGFLRKSYLLSDVNIQTGGVHILYPHLSDIEKLKVEKLVRVLRRDQVITKHRLNGEIEIMSLDHYRNWIRIYGDEMLILIAKLD